MKRLLLSFAMLLALIGTIAAETKTPIMLTGGHQDAYTLEEACDVVPLPGSTMEALYGATFTPKNDFTNLFQYKPLEVGQYEKIVVKFGEPVAGDYRINCNAGFFELKGKTEYEIELDGTNIDDFTIFNWGSERAPITITEVYFWSSKTITPSKGKGTWINLINNGTADEGDDLESFPLVLKGNSAEDTGDAPYRPEIVEGGYEGKCLKVTSDQLEETYNDQGNKTWTTWSTQFFLKFNEKLPAGTKVRLSMMVKADSPASVTCSAQGNPRSWIAGIDDAKFEVDTDWTEVTWETTVPENYTTKDGGFGSFAMDLNQDFNSNNFYFDNVKFEKYVPSIGAEFGNQAIQITFPYETNITTLVEAGGRSRLEYPNESATVKVNGTAVNVEYVEADENGTIYVFPTEETVMEENDKVELTFTNPADEAFHVAYTDETKDAIETVELECEWNEELNAVMPYSYGDPVLLSSDPENGSFNLPGNISEFTLTFDKGIDCGALVAKIGKETLTKTPATGFASEVKLTRTGADLANGSYVLNVTNIVGEFSVEGFEGTYDLKFSVGKTDINGDDQPKTIYTSNFTSSGDDANGAGWLENADNGGMQAASSGSGCNIRHNYGGFTADAMYLCTRGTSLGVALYGTEDDHKLALEAKTYHLTLDAAQWDKTDDRRLTVQVLPEEAVNAADGTLVDENAIIASETKAIKATAANKQYEHFDIAVPVKEAGNYVIRFVVDNSESAKGWNDGSAIANVKVEFIPDVLGLMEIKALQAALEAAKVAKEAAEENTKYAGSVLDAISAKIDEYDGKELEMTAPSQFTKAVDELKAATKAMTEHIVLCDSYYELAQKAYNLTISKANFSATEVYQNLKASADKYTTVEGEGEEAIVHVLELTEDEALTAAKNELSETTTLADGLLTEGESKTATKGYAALHERIRQGVETLKNTFGLEEEDEFIVASSNAALGDDDNVAEAVKKRIKLELYGKLKEEGGADELFTSTIDEEDNVITDGPNMTVFIKNPNLYTVGVDQSNRNSVKNNPEVSTAPGWTIECEGGYDVSWSTGWGNYDGTLTIPVDATLTNWGCGYTIKQTITDLPDGTYTLKAGVMERCSFGDEYWSDGGELKLFAMPSGIEDIEDAMVADFSGEFVEGFSGLQDFGLKDNKVLEGIEVSGGELTIGLITNGHTHLFLNNFSLVMTAASGNFAELYNEAVTEVKTVKTAAVDNVYFDLQGRRVAKPTKGLYIVNGKKVVIK